MKKLGDLFERIDVYEHLINENLFPCFIVNCASDNDILYEILQTFSYLKPKLLRIIEGIYFLSLDTNIGYFNDFLKKKLEIFHYEFFSIFLKKNLIEGKLQQFHNIQSDIFYIYYENKNNQINKYNSPQNSVFFQEKSTYPSKFLYGFENFSDLISFYSELIKDESNWPVFALYPLKKDEIKIENQSFKNKISKFNSLPYFSPIKSLFYLSFFERKISKSFRKLNVEELYSIKRIQDVQISHLTTENDIRSFLGFESKIRCFHVFDFLEKTKKNSFFDIQFVFDINDKFLDIKHDLFYLEVQSQFDLSICYSMKYQDSFYLQENNEFSTVFSFKNFNDFIDSKKILYSTIMNTKIHFYIKNIKTFNDDEYEILFNKKSESKLMFIMFRMKKIKKIKESKQQMILSSLLKGAKMIQKDLVCTLDNKKYIVASFDSIQNCENSILMLKKSVYFRYLNSFYPETMNKHKEKDKKYFEDEIQPISNSNNKVKNKNSKFKYHYNDSNSTNVDQNMANKEEKLDQNSLSNENIKKNKDDITKNTNSSISENCNDSSDKKDLLNNIEKNVQFDNSNKKIQKRKKEKGINSIFRYRIPNDSRENSNNDVENNNCGDQNHQSDRSVQDHKASDQRKESTQIVNKNIKNTVNKNMINDHNNEIKISNTENIKLDTEVKNECNNSCKSNQTNNYSNNQTNDYPNNQTNDYPSNKTNDYPNNQTNDYPSNKTNDYPNNQTNDYPNNQTNDYPNNQTKDYPNNQTSNNSNNQTNNYPNIQAIIDSNNQTNNHPNNQTNNYPNNQINSDSNNQTNNNSNPINKNIDSNNSERNKPTYETGKKKKISIDIVEADESPKPNINEEQKKDIGNNNDHYLVDINDYKIINEIGHGSFGKVTLVEHKKTHKKYALKSTLNKSVKTENFKHEIDVYLNNNNCPFILKLVGYTKDSSMLLEYMPNGSLATLIEESQKKPRIKEIFEKKKYVILYGIIYGMLYLHKRKIIHRDLKPENILLDENFFPRISDFGTALIFKDEEKRKKHEKEKAGTVMYAAPEIFIEDKPYTNKVDVYSFAIIIYELLTGKSAFSDLQNINKFKFVKKIQKGFRPDVSIITDQWIKMFIQRCWSPDPTERPSFEDILVYLSNDIVRLAFHMDVDEYIKILAYSSESIQSMKEKNYEEIPEIKLARCFQLMLISESSADHEKGFNIAKEIADKGNLGALYLIASYLFRQTNPNDQKLSCSYFKKLADSGNVNSMICYGNCRLKGIGSTIDFKEAAIYYKKAADLGDQEAMFNYAHMLLTAKGVKFDIKEALKYFQMSADLGNVNAMYQFALIYKEGKLVPCNYELAIKYYKKAAFYGDDESALNLGCLLSSGEVPVDLKEAKFYLEMAVQKGKPNYIFSYAQLLSQIAITGDCNEDEMIIYIKKAKKYYKKAKDLGHEQSELYYNLTKSLLDESIDDLDEFKKHALDGYHQIVKDELPTTLKIGNIELPFINPQNIKYENIKDPKLFDLLLHSRNKKSTDEDKKEDKPKGKIYIPKINPNGKTINKVSVNLYQSIGAQGIKMAFYFMQNNIPTRILNSIDKKIKLIRGVKKEMNQIITDDPNYLYTFYFFPSLDSFINTFSSILDIVKSNHIEKYFPFQSYGSLLSNLIKILNESKNLDPFTMKMKIIQMLKRNYVPMPVPYSMSIGDEDDNEKIDESHNNFLYFDESLIPPKILDVFIPYLQTVKEIIDIKRNIFNGMGILTYIFVEKDKEKDVISMIRNFLSTDDILFEKHIYPLQNVIMFNEKLILKDKDDFDLILHEIESIGLKPINVERNKLYSYDFYPTKKLFQIFSFICFENEKEKMEALNHINPIIYKGQKNILQYNTNYTYARIDEICIPPNVRKSIPSLFNYFKGVEDIQRDVLSIENPVRRTYIGFYPSRKMQETYHKFVYRLNFAQFNPDAKLFYRKKELKYMYIMCEDNSYNYILKRVSSLASDIQKECTESLTVEKNKRSVLYKVTYVGFDTKDELRSAIQRLGNDPNVNQDAYEVFHEDKHDIKISDDPKESYMFYNSL